MWHSRPSSACPQNCTIKPIPFILGGAVLYICCLHYARQSPGIEHSTPAQRGVTHPLSRGDGHLYRCQNVDTIAPNVTMDILIGLYTISGHLAWTAVFSLQHLLTVHTMYSTIVQCHCSTQCHYGHLIGLYTIYWSFGLDCSILPAAPTYSAYNVQHHCAMSLQHLTVEYTVYSTLVQCHCST